MNYPFFVFAIAMVFSVIAIGSIALMGAHVGAHVGLVGVDIGFSQYIVAKAALNELCTESVDE